MLTYGGVSNRKAALASFHVLVVLVLIFYVSRLVDFHDYRVNCTNGFRLIYIIDKILRQHNISLRFRVYKTVRRPF